MTVDLHHRMSMADETESEFRPRVGLLGSKSPQQAFLLRLLIGIFLHIGRSCICGTRSLSHGKDNPIYSQWRSKTLSSLSLPFSDIQCAYNSPLEIVLRTLVLPQIQPFHSLLIVGPSWSQVRAILFSMPVLDT